MSDTINFSIEELQKRVREKLDNPISTLTTSPIGEKTNACKLYITGDLCPKRVADALYPEHDFIKVSTRDGVVAVSDGITVSHWRLQQPDRVVSMFCITVSLHCTQITLPNWVNSLANIGGPCTPLLAEKLGLGGS